MTKQERLQQAWHHFDDRQDHLPSSARQACEWAVAAGLLQLPEIDPYDVLAEDMAQALRAEYGTDNEGRRYRINHAVRVSKAGVQYTFWAEMGFAPHDHMEKAFAQRREQIVGTVSSLRPMSMFTTASLPRVCQRCRWYWTSRMMLRSAKNSADSGIRRRLSSFFSTLPMQRCGRCPFAVLV